MSWIYQVRPRASLYATFLIRKLRGTLDRELHHGWGSRLYVDQPPPSGWRSGNSTHIVV